MMKPLRIGLAINHSYGYYRRVLRGISRFAETRPEWIFTSIIAEQQPLRELGRFRPVGVIASVDMAEMVPALSSWRRPIINITNVLPGLRFPRVGVDNVRVGQLAADHFLERGLRHFGFVGPPDQAYSMERQAAFCQALQKAGHTVACYHTPVNLPPDPYDRQWELGRGVDRWLRGLPKPVGVLAPGDNWGIQLAEACRQARLSVPEGIALLSVDDDDLNCELARPRLSSVILPAEEIGYKAAALLDRLLAGKKPPAEPILLAPSGVAARRSTDMLAIEDRDVVAAVRFIREHAHVSLSVHDVVRHTHLGRRTLERRCREALGWGLGKEIRRSHLESACRLLARTDLPMKSVARQSGFSGLRQLGEVFRQELGMPPTAYRRNIREPGH